VKDCTIRTTCRLCDGPLSLGLSLTPTPPANELVTREFVESGAKQDTFPLDVMVCGSCAHVQLSAVVNPERLFRHYPYRSGASAQFVRHLEAYADEVCERFQPLRKVVEIGSNDGTFLRRVCHRTSGVVRTVGFEPAANIAKMAEEAGVCTVPDFFSVEAYRKLNRGDEPVDIIVANHVFAHADDLRGMALAVKELLADDGVFVFEVGYLLDMVLKGQWDCIYGEHLSYWHLHPAIKFFESLGLQLFDAHRVDTQGGSIRCFVKKPTFPSQGSGRLNYELLAEERDKLFMRPKDIGAHLDYLGYRMDSLRLALKSLLGEAKVYDKRIAAYGAPAKAVTFLHQMGIGADVIDYVVDDSPLKQGLYVPGKNIPIVSGSVRQWGADYCLILGWNFAQQIMDNNHEYRGKWIIPLPELRVVG
jgi:SAM-dependent methyltransferase